MPVNKHAVKNKFKFYVFQPSPFRTFGKQSVTLKGAERSFSHFLRNQKSHSGHTVQKLPRTYFYVVAKTGNRPHPVPLALKMRGFPFSSLQAYSTDFHLTERKRTISKLFLILVTNTVSTSYRFMDDNRKASRKYWEESKVITNFATE